MTDLLISQLQAYQALFPGEAPTVERSLDLLRKTGQDIRLRSSTPAHITASLLIVSDSSLLTIWHPYLKAWIQPGGHIESGEAPIEAALREAVEETGRVCELYDWHIQNANLPFDVDCLFVPANPLKSEGEHWHIDFRYLMRPRSGHALQEAELQTRYVDLNLLGDISPSLARLCLKLKSLPGS